MHLSPETRDRIRKLPLWAQCLIDQLTNEVGDLERQLDVTRNASRITTDPARTWFTIQGPPQPKADPYHLWRLHEDSPHRICALNHGDVLLVGRKKES